jgi:hypothetical protein
MSDRGAKAQAPAGRILTIEARPQAVSIDTATTAVIVVDMQNDFGTKGGMFDRAGIDISGIQRPWNQLPMFSIWRGKLASKSYTLKWHIDPIYRTWERLIRLIERNTYGSVLAKAPQRPMERRAAY